MKNKKISDILPNQLTEQHEGNESDFRLGYILKHNNDFALMRAIDDDGVTGAYFFWDYQMDQSCFFQETDYIKYFKKFIELARENGLKNTPKIQEVENLPFNHPLDEMIELLDKEKIYTDVDVFNSETKDLITYDGYITDVEKDTIGFFTPNYLNEDDQTIGMKRKINIDGIYSFNFNSWEGRFATQVIKEKRKQK